MDLTLSTCFVQVQDPETSLAFYRDVLGLDVLNDVANEGFRWISVGSPSQGGVSIVLTNYVNGGPADSDVVAGLLAKGAMNGVNFHTKDLDGIFKKLESAGAEILSPPTDQPWGVRDCAVRDPSGNMIRIDQVPDNWQ